MTYDHEVTLISQTYEQDEIGNQIPVESETTVLCGKRSVGRSEFYNAAANGMRPELVLVIHGYEYHDEKVVRFEGAKYNVVRSYATTFEEIELTCEKVIGNGVN